MAQAPLINWQKLSKPVEPPLFHESSPLTLRLITIVCALLASNFEHVLAAQLDNVTALPGGSCRVKPLEKWSSQEKWVWKRICEGEIADFNTARAYGGSLDPKKLEGWSAKRALRSQFLQTILLFEPFRSALPQSGVRIVGAWFQEPMDLYNATLAHPVALVGCRFERSVYFDLLKIPNYLILNASKFNALLSMTGLKVAGVLEMKTGEFVDVDLGSAHIEHHLYMNDSNFTKSLNLNAAHISGTLNMEQTTVATADLSSAKIDDQIIMVKSKFKEPLWMSGLQVGGSIFMEDASFTDVDLHRATIDQVLSFNKSKLSGKLILESLRLGGDLHMSNATITQVNLRAARIDDGIWMNDSEFKEIDLTSAKVGGDLVLSNSRLLQQLIMENVRVGNTLSLRGLQVKQGSLPIQIVFAEVASSLFIEDGMLGSLDLSGTKIRGVFFLGWEDHTSLKWHSDSKLTLRNTEVGAIQDLANIWPDKLELTGFTYAHLGGIDTAGTDDPANRETNWYINWLERQVSYSPQPYEQLASVLRKSGLSDKAEEVLYTGRNRELGEATGLELLWLLLLKALIGFGHRIHYALFWFFSFVCTGAIVLRLTGQGSRYMMPYGLSYSFDMLLPIVDLREHHKEVELSGFAKYYFYFHKIMGFILVSFILAGLAGLTKQSF
jgi:uncharacterized protein YjbI with pentapeptide repeats